MGRRSKLTEDEWAEVLHRHLYGESMRSLGKEFDIAEGAIRKRISKPCAKIRSVVDQILAAENRISALPKSAQELVYKAASDIQRRERAAELIAKLLPFLTDA